MLSMVICCPSMGGHEVAQESWITNMTDQEHLSIVLDDTHEGEEAGFLHKLQHMYEITHEDVIGYLHSDLIIHEQGWDARVLREFDDPRVGVVGFVGATGLGDKNIY